MPQRRKNDRYRVPASYKRLAGPFIQGLNSDWCVDFQCTTCGAYYFGNALFLLLHDGDQSKKFSEKNLLTLFPYDFTPEKDPDFCPKALCRFSDDIIHSFTEADAFDEYVISQTTAFRIATQVKKLGLTLERSEFKSWASMCGCNYRTVEIAANALKEDRRYAEFLYEEFLSDGGGEPVSPVFSEFRNKIREMKWLILSALERAAKTLDDQNKSYISCALSDFAARNQDLGWIFDYYGKKRGVERKVDKNAFRQVKLRAEKNEWLTRFKNSKDIWRLKMIAHENFSYRIEFIPNEYVRGFTNLRRRDIGSLSFKERQRIRDWIGGKSGPWQSVRKLLGSPMVISNNPAEQLVNQSSDARPELKLLKFRPQAPKSVEWFLRAQERDGKVVTFVEGKGWVISDPKEVQNKSETLEENNCDE